MRTVTIISALLALAILSVGAADSKWQRVPNKMTTEWGRAVTPKNAWREYPRPQFARADWQNLNGLWDYTITAKDATPPAQWLGEILVPFAVESTLSGVGQMLAPDQALWYRRTFELKPRSARRVLLNFEAVDYYSTVWVNGQQVGEHIGEGFNSFVRPVAGSRADEPKFLKEIFENTPCARQK